MHRTTTTTATVTALAAALLLTSCGSGGDAQAKPTASSSPTATTRAYDAYDCKALLERNYDADNIRDASDDPECETLTSDEYASAVADVIAGHKDDILNDAANHVAWDAAWDETDADQQQTVCDRLQADGATVVGQEMADASTDSSGDEVEMAQYYLDEKC